MMRSTALSTLLIAAGASAQFVAAPSGFTTKTGNANVTVRYKQVPTGICEQDPNVKSFAGYSDVAENEHYFWWFFETRNGNASEAPLTIWINGGPGSSSMIGLFQELGPCGVDDTGTVYNNPYSYSNVSNMLFIDQPATVGFSYNYAQPGYTEPLLSTFISLPSNDCPGYITTCLTGSAWNISTVPNSTANAAPNFYRTLQGFIGAFPQYVNGGVNFATESYGGHYGGIFSKYILEQNAAGQYPKIDLQNLMIGNGWYDPLLAYSAYVQYTITDGNPYFGKNLFNSSIQQQMNNSMYGAGNCYDQLVRCQETGDNLVCMIADQFCATNVELLYDEATGRDEYDMRELTPDPFPYNFYEQYLNTPRVQEAVGAYVNWTSYSALVGGGQGTIVGNAFGATGDDGREDGTIEALRYLLANNVSVTTWFGDADYNCNIFGGYQTMLQLNASGWASAGYTNISVPGLNSTQGLVKQSGMFSFSRVFSSGHEIPFYQPELALAVFDRAINRKDIANGNATVTSDYKTSGPTDGMLSVYPEGNSTVQYNVLSVNATYPPPVNSTTSAHRQSFRKQRFRRH